MRRTILLLLTAVLAGLIAARSGQRPPAEAQAAAAMSWSAAGYNVLEAEPAAPPETAGSALIAEMNGYFLSRTPTAKHQYTGLLAGRDLIVLLAEDWRPEGLNAGQAPALHRLWREGVQFAQVYAPEWYQGLEGREFALLSGLTPTNVQDRSSMALLEEKSRALPFSLAAGLAQAGYVCRACPAGPGREAAYEALGFSSVRAGGTPEEQLPQLWDQGPYLLYCVLPEADGEAALESLLQTLEAAGRTNTTAICLVTGSAQALRGGLYLWGRGLEGLSVAAPCSELDVTPTLLDLFGAAYDARFLSGRDLLADGTADGPLPPVSLGGSAYCDWVSDAGSYVCAEDAFFPADSRFKNAQAQARYVRQARQQVYDRYVYSRRILERDYFRLVLGR